MIMVCSLIHCCQASLETFSQSFLPSSPGMGGRSRPSASRPSLMQLTMRATVFPFAVNMRKARSLPRLARGATSAFTSTFERRCRL
jgi:hypothetical protein